MKTLIFALLVSGCVAESTNYDVRLGEESAPMCTGYMTLMTDTLKHGTWACWPYGGEAVTDFGRVSGTNFLNLETKPGYFNEVRFPPADIINGAMLMTIGGEYAEVPFLATPQ